MTQNTTREKYEDNCLSKIQHEIIFGAGRVSTILFFKAVGFNVWSRDEEMGASRAWAGTVSYGSHSVLWHMWHHNITSVWCCIVCHVVGWARHRLPQMSLCPLRLFVMTPAPTPGTFQPVFRIILTAAQILG